MFRLILFIAMAGVVAIVVAGCDADNPTDSYVNPVVVSGELLACIDSIEDTPNELFDDRRYTVTTGRHASLVFFGPGGSRVAIDTDDSSAFNVSLIPGNYAIKVETDHTFPDLFDSVEITCDTSLNLVVNYDIRVVDTILVRFGYCSLFGQPVPAPLGEETERTYLGQLNRSVDSVLIPEGAPRTVFVLIDPDNGTIVSYHVPIDTTYRLWKVYLAAQQLLHSSGSGFPQLMTVDLAWIHLGLDPEDFIWWDTLAWEPFDSIPFPYEPPDSTTIDSCYIPDGWDYPDTSSGYDPPDTTVNDTFYYDGDSVPDTDFPDSSWGYDPSDDTTWYPGDGGP